MPETQMDPVEQHVRREYREAGLAWSDAVRILAAAERELGEAAQRMAAARRDLAPYQEADE